MTQDHDEDDLELFRQATRGIKTIRDGQADNG